jgi:hypothetical protein
MAKKNYNMPAAITDYVRYKDRKEMDRAKREMGTESDISKDDKDALKELLKMEKGESKREGEEPMEYRKGGMVKTPKASKSGSRRGDGCAVKGRTKGKMY